MLEKQGGFGKFQKLTLATYIFSIGSTGWLVYGLPYLLLYPEFVCKGITTGTPEYYEKCVPSYFCNHVEISWFVLKKSEHTLVNWISLYDLTCESPFLVSAFGMSYFFGFFVGSFFLPNMSDKNGRKSYFLAIQFILMSTCLLIVLLPFGAGTSITTVYILIFIFGIQGIASSGRLIIGYCLLNEYSPVEYHTMNGTLWNISEGSMYLMLTFYYKFISKNWMWPIVWSIMQYIITFTIIYFFIPESPKWLYDKKRF